MVKTPDTPETLPPRVSGTMSSREFWELVDRLHIPDAEALELIEYTGKIGGSGKRPRFRLSTRQTRVAAYLPEIAVALQTDWRRTRVAASAQSRSAIRGPDTNQSHGRGQRGRGG